MQSIRRSAIAGALCALFVIACDSDEAKVGRISHAIDVRGYDDGRPTERLETLDFTLPKGFTIGSVYVIAIDSKGRRFRPSAVSLSSNGEQRFKATFPVAEDSQLTMLQFIGHDVDLQAGRIRRTLPAAGATGGKVQ